MVDPHRLAWRCQLGHQHLYGSSSYLSYLFYKQLCPALLHLSHFIYDICHFLLFLSCANPSITSWKLRLNHYMNPNKDGCLYNSFVSWLKYIWMIASKHANRRMLVFANEKQYSLLPAAFSGTINLELWKADKTFCLLILWRWKKK